MTLERKVLTEFLQLYREFPCLWDNRQVLYCNKEARDQAYEVLLEKYKLIHEDASILDVKKKIEHMRCAYRREHKKVLLSRLKGDLKEYQPSLWYYDVLSFINEVCHYNQLEPMSRENGEDSVKIEFVDHNHKPKTRKRKISTIYLPEQHGSDDDDEVQESMDDLCNQDNDSNRDQSMHAPVTEAEAFGTTVGLQLRDLEPMQRVIAEKLISDIIFQARLNKLNIDSSINT